VARRGQARHAAVGEHDRRRPEAHAGGAADARSCRQVCGRRRAGRRRPDPGGDAPPDPEGEAGRRAVRRRGAGGGDVRQAQAAEGTGGGDSFGRKRRPQGDPRSVSFPGGNPMRTVALLALSLVAACSPESRQEPKREYPAPAALPVRADLPDPLVMFDGRKVETRDQWEKERKPELRALFQHYMYGHLPPKTDLRATVRRTDPKAFGGKATLSEVSLALGDGPKFEVLLVIPNQRTGPAPVFLGLNFSGNHAIVTDPAVAIPTTWMRQGKGDDVVNNRASEKGRGKAVGTWALEQSIDRGYAVATCYYGDIFADKADMADGVFKHFQSPAPGQKSPGDTGPGAISMWAWGLHR